MSTSKFRRSADGRTRRRRGPSTPFVMLHWFMLDSPAWQSLSGVEAKAYVAIARRYDGSNNGRIAVPTRTLATKIGCSNATAARAIITLLDRGFLECVEASGFNRKNRKAAEYRLTMYSCDLTNKPATKAFMGWSPQSRPGDCADFSQSHLRLSQSHPRERQPSKRPIRSHPRDCQTQNGAADSRTRETHIESATATATTLDGRASAPVGSAVASEPVRGDAPKPMPDRGRFEVELADVVGFECLMSLPEERVAELCELKRVQAPSLPKELAQIKASWLASKSVAATSAGSSDGNREAARQRLANLPKPLSSCDFPSAREEVPCGSKNANLAHSHAGFDTSTHRKPENGDAFDCDASKADRWGDLDIATYLRRERIGAPALSSGPDDDLGDLP